MHAHLCFLCLMPKEARRGHWIPLGLELQMVVSCHVYAGNRIQVPCKSIQCSSGLSHLSSPANAFLMAVSRQCGRVQSSASLEFCPVHQAVVNRDAKRREVNGIPRVWGHIDTSLPLLLAIGKSFTYLVSVSSI